MAEQKSIDPLKVYIRNLEWSIDNTDLNDLFGKYGEITEARVITDSRTNKSRGYGFITFKDAKGATSALDMSGQIVNDREITVVHARESPKDRVKVSGLPRSIECHHLKKEFSAFGKVVKAVVCTTNNGESRGYGFVQYENEKGAEAALEKGTTVEFLGVAVRAVTQAPPERKEPPKTRLFIKGFGPEIEEEDLKKMFAEFGTVNLSLIKQDKENVYAFAQFSDEATALRAKETLSKNKDLEVQDARPRRSFRRRPRGGKGGKRGGKQRRGGRGRGGRGGGENNNRQPPAKKE